MPCEYSAIEKFKHCVMGPVTGSGEMACTVIQFMQLFQPLPPPDFGLLPGLEELEGLNIDWFTW